MGRFGLILVTNCLLNLKSFSRECKDAVDTWSQTELDLVLDLFLAWCRFVNFLHTSSAQQAIQAGMYHNNSGIIVAVRPAHPKALRPAHAKQESKHQILSNSLCHADSSRGDNADR